MVWPTAVLLDAVATTMTVTSCILIHASPLPLLVHQIFLSIRTSRLPSLNQAMSFIIALTLIRSSDAVGEP